MCKGWWTCYARWDIGYMLLYNSILRNAKPLEKVGELIAYLVKGSLKKTPSLANRVTIIDN